MPSSCPLPDPAPSEREVLIVEDDPTTGSLLQTLFADEGLQTTLCQDGAAAYDVIIASRPSLVILDLLLPGRDGMDVLARVKGNPRTATIPIIVCSAAESLLNKSSSIFELWDCRVVPKPFDVDELASEVHRSLAGQSRSERQVGQPAL
jgi:DNA-binding response OmpR family regulator